MATKIIKAWIDGAIQEIEVEDIISPTQPLSVEDRLIELEDKPIITDGNLLVGNGTEELEEMTPDEVLSHINGVSVVTMTTAEYEAMDESETNANALYVLTDSETPNVVVSPATAEVGQIIAVKTADESGKPTEWEAVDMPSGDIFYVNMTPTGENTATSDKTFDEIVEAHNGKKDVKCRLNTYVLPLCSIDNLQVIFGGAAGNQTASVVQSSDNAVFFGTGELAIKNEVPTKEEFDTFLLHYTEESETLTSQVLDIERLAPETAKVGQVAVVKELGENNCVKKWEAVDNIRYVASDTEPVDKNVMWIDTSDNTVDVEQVVIDTTLTQSGWAADAKKTGDAIKLKADLDYVLDLENNKMPRIDNKLQTAGKAADAKATGDAISKITTQLNGMIYVGDTEPTNVVDGMVWIDTSESQSTNNENNEVI